MTATSDWCAPRGVSSGRLRRRAGVIAALAAALLAALLVALLAAPATAGTAEAGPRPASPDKTGEHVGGVTGPATPAPAAAATYAQREENAGPLAQFEGGGGGLYIGGSTVAILLLILILVIIL